MADDSFDAAPSAPPRRRLGPKAWAAIGCGLLTVLALAAIGSCGLLLSNVLGRLASDREASERGADIGLDAGSARPSAPPAAQTPAEIEGVPSWIPLYPDAVPEVRSFVVTPDAESGAIALSLSEPLDDVVAFYEATLDEAGFVIETSSLEAGGLAGGMLGASLPERALGLTLMFSPAGDETLVVIHHTRWAGPGD